MTEPRTDAGRRLAEADAQALWSPAEVRAAILAIEEEASLWTTIEGDGSSTALPPAEAAQGAAPRWTTDPDPFAGTEPDHFGTCVDCDHLWTLHGEPGCRKDGCVCTERYIEGAAPRAEGPTDEERAAFKRSEWERIADLHPGAPRAEGLDAALADILRWTKPGSLYADGTNGYSPAGPEKVARIHNRAREAFGDAPLPPARLSERRDKEGTE